MTPALAVPLVDALRSGTRRLAAAGVASPRTDAEALAAHLLGVRRGSLLTAGPVDTGAYDALLARRVDREPLQHIVGSTGFRYLDVLVGAGVFVPRPETELVAGAAVEAARAAAERAGTAGSGDGAAVVVDLCTGSGAIALAVAHEVPGADVHAVELDMQALGWARRNIEATGLPVTLHQADVTTAVPGLDGRVDVVVSNPPYLPEGVPVDPEVRHDPPLSLWGGTDGLSTVRAVVATAARLLRPGGVLVVEHDDSHATTAPALLAAVGGWEEVVDHDDLAGRPRYVTARRAP